MKYLPKVLLQPLADRFFEDAIALRDAALDLAASDDEDRKRLMGVATPGPFLDELIINSMVLVGLAAADMFSKELGLEYPAVFEQMKKDMKNGMD